MEPVNKFKSQYLFNSDELFVIGNDSPVDDSICFGPVSDFLAAVVGQPLQIDQQLHLPCSRQSCNPQFNYLVSS